LFERGLYWEEVEVEVGEAEGGGREKEAGFVDEGAVEEEARGRRIDAAARIADFQSNIDSIRMLL